MSNFEIHMPLPFGPQAHVFGWENEMHPGTHVRNMPQHILGYIPTAKMPKYGINISKNMLFNHV